MNREQQVEFFNKAMGQAMTDDHLSVPLKLRQLGIGLIFEELKELAISSGCEGTFNELSFNSLNKSLGGWISSTIDTGSEAFRDKGTIDEVEQIDGLVDVQYTLSWCVNVFGHRSRFEKAYDEVCASNNSKACKTREEAEQTITYWEDKDGLPCHFEEVDGLFVVKNNKGKVKKSINYIPTNYKFLFPIR